VRERERERERETNQLQKTHESQYSEQSRVANITMCSKVENLFYGNRRHKIEREPPAQVLPRNDPPANFEFALPARIEKFETRQEIDGDIENE